MPAPIRELKCSKKLAEKRLQLTEGFCLPWCDSLSRKLGCLKSEKVVPDDGLEEGVDNEETKEEVSSVWLAPNSTSKCHCDCDGLEGASQRSYDSTRPVARMLRGVKARHRTRKWGTSK